MKRVLVGLGSAVAVLTVAVASASASSQELLKDEAHFLQQSSKSYTGGEKAAQAFNMEVVGHTDLGGRGFNGDVWVHEGSPTSVTGVSGLGDRGKGRFCPEPPPAGSPWST